MAMRTWFIASAAAVALLCSACRTDGAGSGPPVPASSDPEGKDLVEGAIVIAYEEPSQSYRLYKIKKINFFPPPMGDELVMIAFQETGNDFQHASDLWRRGELSVAVPNARVQRVMFNKRDYRVIDVQPVTEIDHKLTAGDVLPKGG